ncbi:uncharacterized protein Rubicon isoform X2 [Lepeophtheirus salmonis]|uniref:uncharacterized protein Rubicon isoform X2 n=1 Tax=Lepeophtheirus salmonis TaxID=72036 RepID=UPI001AE3F84E|nr:uncharacterized protein LOC121116830 isoform X2 [Lepeophtheirus salmonis]
MNHDLKRLISGIESLLTGSGGTLVFHGSSVHFVGLDKLLRITKEILKNGSISLDTEGNPSFLPFIMEILPLKSESEFDDWIKDKMANSLFSQALSSIVSAEDSLKRHYDMDSMLRCPNSSEKLILAAKCLDEQDLPTLVALDLRRNNKCSYDKVPDQDIEPNTSSLKKDDVFFVTDERICSFSSSCPGLTELEIRRFLKRKNWIDDYDDSSPINSVDFIDKYKSPLPKELENTLRKQQSCETYHLGNRPKTSNASLSDIDDFFISDNSFVADHSSPIVPVRGTEILRNEKTKTKLISTPKRTHRRTTSDTRVFQLMSSGSIIKSFSESLNKHDTDELDHNWSTITPPTEGWIMPLPMENESLYSYLSSGAFSRHQARLDRENAHLILAELIIQASTKKYGDPCMGKGVITASNFRPPAMPSFGTSNRNMNIRENSAESVALSLLDQFDDKHETKASELNLILGDYQTTTELSFPSSDFNGSQSQQERNSSGSVDHNTTCKDEIVTELRGTHDWAPPRPQLILQPHVHKSRTELLEEQKYRCSGCAMKVEKKYSKIYRYCHYFGRLFCTGCHSNATHVIPANVIKKWDFKTYFVSDFASTVLHSMYSDPLFNIQDLNPELLGKISKLRKAIEVRSLSTKIYHFVINCRLETQYMSEISNYPVIDPYTFSLEDLCRIKSKNYSSVLSNLLENLMQHIVQCSLCKARGFLCEGCRSQDVLFPFETDVHQCPRCYACYHKPCYFEDCSKCQRIDQRKNAARTIRI